MPLPRSSGGWRRRGCLALIEGPAGAVLARVHVPMPGISRAITVPGGAGAWYWCGKPQMNVRSTRGRYSSGWWSSPAGRTASRIWR